MRAPAARAASTRGATSVGCANVLHAFTSDPVIVSQNRARVGVGSRHARTGELRARLVGARVDRAAAVLQERAAEPPIQLGPVTRRVDHGARRALPWRRCVTDLAQPRFRGERCAAAAEVGEKFPAIQSPLYGRPGCLGATEGQPASSQASASIRSLERPWSAAS